MEINFMLGFILYLDNIFWSICKVSVSAKRHFIVDNANV